MDSTFDFQPMKYQKHLNNIVSLSSVISANEKKFNLKIDYSKLHIANLSVKINR
ncbi:MAG: hypothetical protein ACI8VZ_001253 [Candidatus Paceibacteria bacterium]|jgi:hypothetical protein